MKLSDPRGQMLDSISENDHSYTMHLGMLFVPSQSIQTVGKIAGTLFRLDGLDPVRPMFSR